MKLNEDFKVSATKAYSLFKTLIILILLFALMYEYLTIASNNLIRVVDIKTPWFSTQFLQEIK